MRISGCTCCSKKSTLTPRAAAASALDSASRSLTPPFAFNTAPFLEYGRRSSKLRHGYVGVHSGWTEQPGRGWGNMADTEEGGIRNRVPTEQESEFGQSLQAGPWLCGSHSC